jgi:hypothetical protein
VAEIRRNRYARGLYVNVTGHVKETYLTDVPRQTIEMLETALRETLTTNEAGLESMAATHVSESQSGGRLS